MKVKIEFPKNAPTGPPPELIFYQCLECGKLLEKDESCPNCERMKEYDDTNKRHLWGCAKGELHKVPDECDGFWYDEV